MSALATRAQIGAIHALKSRIGLDEGGYREVLKGFGVISSKDLSRVAAAQLIDRWKGSAPAQPAADRSKPRARGALHLDGPYAGVCRALWLTAWNLGLLRDRTDRALVAFVERQTKIAHLNWVRDPADGNKAIEALKGWITRETGMRWPTEKGARQAGVSLSTARKLSVIATQKHLLGIEHAPVEHASDPDLDAATQAFGRAIRAARARQED